MPAPVSYGAFSLINPDIALQQQQLERQQALVDAMRQSSMQPIDAGRGQISPWQGVAKMAQALAANLRQGRIDKKGLAIANVLRDRMGPGGGMFGHAGTPVVNSEGGTPTFGGGPNSDGTMSLSSGGGDPTSAPVSPAGSPQFNAAFADMQPPQPNPAPVTPQAQQPPPQQPPSAAGGSSWQPGPLSLSGDPQADSMRFMMNPEEYTKAVISGSAPADFTKLLQQSGIDPHSALGQQIMQNQVAKQNHMPVENMRGGSWSLNPATGEKNYNPQLPEGAEPVFDAHQNVVGVRMLDGTVQAIAAVEGAKAGSRAAAQTPYELVEVVDPKTGDKHFVPKSQLTGGQGAGSPQGAPGGSLNSFYNRGGGAPQGGGNQSSIGPGQQASNTEAGKNSANGFNAAIQGGVDAKNAIQTINSIMTAAKGLPTGQGSGAISDVKSMVNAATGAAGYGPVFDRAQIAKFDEMKKNTAILGSQLASAGAGSNGVTDAKLGNALNAVPGAHYSPQAIQAVASRLRGLQAAAMGRSNAAAAWQQQNGANSFPAFQQQWSHAYNPDIFEQMQQGPAAFAKWANSMSPADRQRTLGQYRALKGMGAF